MRHNPHSSKKGNLPPKIEPKSTSDLIQDCWDYDDGSKALGNYDSCVDLELEISSINDGSKETKKFKTAQFYRMWIDRFGLNSQWKKIQKKKEEEQEEDSE